VGSHAAVILSASMKTFNKPAVIRDCLFEGRLSLHAAAEEPRGADMLIVRSQFGQQVQAGGFFRTLALRENVLGGDERLSFYNLKEAEALEISNNTILRPVAFSVALPSQSVFLCNNLLRRGPIELDLGAEKRDPAPLKSWRIGHNIYQTHSGGAGTVPQGKT